MRWPAACLAFAVALGTGSPAIAQAGQCRVPDVLPAPRAEGPTPREPARRMAVTRYTLALSWQPEYCRFRAASENAGDRIQCAANAGTRGFTLHGLWPDGDTGWPQYCAPAAILPKAVIQENFCATPSVQLLQHEWAKHGTCVATDPARYFRAARRMFGAVRIPDMIALSRAQPTIGEFALAFAAANPGLTEDMILVQTNRRGWLSEVHLCLARDLKPERCPIPMTAADRARPIAIWRGG
jgi:ribonuclease T2